VGRGQSFAADEPDRIREGKVKSTTSFLPRKRLTRGAGEEKGILCARREVRYFQGGRKPRSIHFKGKMGMAKWEATRGLKT